jgi:diguanylate cyclase (GGDEF)-like protein
VWYYIIICEGAIALFSLNSWRYYTLGREEYIDCKKKIFAHNLISLRQANTACAVLGLCFMLFPVIVEKDLYKAGVYLSVSAIATLIAVFSGYLHKQHQKGTPVSNSIIYTLILLGYTNAISFGIYIGVWSQTEGSAVSFMAFLICGLFLFNTPPAFNLSLTLGAIAVFITFTVAIKEPQYWVYDVTNVIMAGCLSVIFTWHVAKFRILAAFSTSRLEKERNSYFDQSTIDELTQLKNRRDFVQTFQRYMTKHRDTDSYLCLAIADIDYFKKYNDHYGHSMGDKCLRSIGKTFNNLKDETNVYSARVGGEEFALLWFEKERAGADKVVLQVRQMIDALKIPHIKSKVSEHITISIGVHMVRCDAADNIHAIYESADKALYEAKNTGRNRAVFYTGGGIS